MALARATSSCLCVTLICLCIYTTILFIFSVSELSVVTQETQQSKPNLTIPIATNQTKGDDDQDNSLDFESPPEPFWQTYFYTVVTLVVLFGVFMMYKIYRADFTDESTPQLIRHRGKHYTVADPDDIPLYDETEL